MWVNGYLNKIVQNQLIPLCWKHILLLSSCSLYLHLNMCKHNTLLLSWIPHNLYWYATERIWCGATLINSQYAVSAFHCIRGIANNFGEMKEKYGLSSSTKPLDLLIIRHNIVAGAYYSRNYTLNSDSEPEYKFQVSMKLMILFIIPYTAKNS